jgi:integrase/recombinase XerC
VIQFNQLKGDIKMNNTILKERFELDNFNSNKMNYQDLIDSFINYIDVSENTMITYKRSLKQFWNYMKMRNIQFPTRENIIEFKEYLLENNKPNTANLYLASVKNFYKWLEYMDITKDISKNIKSVSIPNEHLKQAFNIEQIKLLLDNCKNIREKMIILLTFSCGIRSNELVNIRLEDFKEKNNVLVLYLLGKGRKYKQDYVIIPTNVKKILIEYIKEYNIKDYLFVSTSNNNNGGKLTTKTIRYIANKLFEDCGLKDEEHTFHSLRHSFATESIKSGIDIREVSQALRHKSISVTMSYLHDLEKTKNKCSTNVANLLNI